MEVLGSSLQKQLILIRSRGFEKRWVLVDSHTSLIGFAGNFPGTIISMYGAGNHKEKVNVRMTKAITDNAFGDWIDACNPRSKKDSNNVLAERMEPCTALYSLVSMRALVVSQ
jgi:hypothetical protein